MDLAELHNLLGDVARQLYTKTHELWDKPLREELTKYAEENGFDPKETYRLELGDRAYFNDSRSGEAVYGVTNLIERIQRDVAVRLLREHRFD